MNRRKFISYTSGLTFASIFGFNISNQSAIAVDVFINQIENIPSNWDNPTVNINLDKLELITQNIDSSKNITVMLYAKFKNKSEFTFISEQEISEFVYTGSTIIDDLESFPVSKELDIKNKLENKEKGDSVDIDLRFEFNHPDINVFETEIKTINIDIVDDDRTYEIISNNNLLLHYPLNDFTEDTVFDNTDNEYNGTNNGVENRNDSADFNDSGYIDVPKESNKTISEEFSISLWIKQDSHATFYTEIDDTTNYLILRSNKEYPDFRLSADDTDIGVDFNANIIDNEWIHIVATYNSNNGLKLYVDGHLDAETNDTIGSVNLGEQSINIGRDARGQREMNGKMANFQVYATELQEENIELLSEDKPLSIRK